MPHALREALAGFRRAPLLTGLSAAMMGLALFVVGLFAVSTHNLREALRTVEERVEVVAFVRDDARSGEVELAVGDLQGMPEVRAVRYVSKEEALRKAREELPEFQEVFTDLDMNPLPASLEIELVPESRGPEGIERVFQRARAYPFVEDVRYGREWVEPLFTLRRVGAVATAVLGGAFAGVAVLIIGTAVRIAIFARKDEIYVMRLVGAKDSFIRAPFLLEGALSGVAGGLLAILLTWMAWAAVDRFLVELSWIPAAWIGAGILAGGVMGLLASRLAMRRYLREVR